MDKSPLHQFGTKMFPGILIGHGLNSGGGWTGDVIIADCQDIENRSRNQEIATSFFFLALTLEITCRTPSNLSPQESRELRPRGGVPSTVGVARSDPLPSARSDSLQEGKISGVPLHDGLEKCKATCFSVAGYRDSYSNPLPSRPQTCHGYHISILEASSFNVSSDRTVHPPVAWKSRFGQSYGIHTRNLEIRWRPIGSILHSLQVRKQNLEYVLRAHRREQSWSRRLNRAELRTEQRVCICELPESPKSNSYAPSTDEIDADDFHCGALIDRPDHHDQVTQTGWSIIIQAYSYGPQACSYGPKQCWQSRWLNRGLEGSQNSCDQTSYQDSWWQLWSRSPQPIFCEGIDIVQSDHAPEAGVAQGIFHGDLIRHQGGHQEGLEEEQDEEVERRVRRDHSSNQTQVRMHGWHGMTHKARPWATSAMCEHCASTDGARRAQNCALYTSVCFVVSVPLFAMCSRLFMSVCRSQMFVNMRCRIHSLYTPRRWQ